MYKNIEVLDKNKHGGVKFDEVAEVTVAKNIGVVPIGVNEVFDMCSIAPVIISAGDSGEFVAFTGLSNTTTIYNNDNLYVPKFIKAYPFLNIDAKDEKGNPNPVIAIDNNQECVGTNKKNAILNKKGEPEKLAAAKMEIVRELNSYREISKKIVQELKSKNLLEKKDFRVNANGEEKIVLKEFYTINRDELVKQDDKTLALWARKGWMSIIDAHVKSLGNFEKLLVK
ncbi:MAG: SapC family protein [Campylobacterota bacterium]|nr:SapC family protein [Campylobacterota bacterium]